MEIILISTFFLSSSDCVLFLKHDEFAADEINEGGGEDEDELGDPPTGLEGTAEEGPGEDAGDAADEVDEAEEGELDPSVVATAGEDPDDVGEVGDEVADGEGPEIGVDLVPFEDVLGGAVERGEPVFREPPGGGGVGEGRHDAAEPVFGELDDEGGVFGFEEMKCFEWRVVGGVVPNLFGLSDPAVGAGVLGCG